MGLLKGKGSGFFSKKRDRDNDKEKQFGPKKFTKEASKEKKEVKKKEPIKVSKVPKITGWNDLSIKELNELYENMKRELQDLRFQLAISKIPNIRRIRQLKRDIARALTYKNQKSKAS